MTGTALVAAVPRADAQVMAGANYAVVTAKVGPHHDALCVLDLAQRKLAVFRLDTRTYRIKATDVKGMKREFGREGGR